MARFENYSSKFETIKLRREDGILEMRLHSDDGPLRWSLTAHDELEEAFLEIGRDPENEVLILTGTGEEFSGPDVDPGASGQRAISASEFDQIARVGKNMLMNLLNIEVPVIGAVNGPARRHPELPLMSNIVLASEDAIFQDPAHFRGGMVPGDGVHVVFPYLMGATRASYFLLTAQELGALEAKEAGLVNEVLSKARLLPRAWELARMLLRQPTRVRRFSRQLLTHEIKCRMHAQLGHGFALEAYAQIASGART